MTASSDPTGAPAEDGAPHEDVDAPREGHGRRPTFSMHDPWASGGTVRLDRGLERVVHGEDVRHFALGFAALVAGFVVFQFVVAPVVLVALLGVGGQLSADALAEPGYLTQLLAEHTREVILSNTAGQALGLALVGWVFAWMHTSHTAAFLRLRRPDATLLGLGLLLLLALQPTVYFLGYLNQQLPLPEPLRLMEEEQLRMIEQVLAGDLSLLFVVVTLAVTPGLCEELLFRGYAQRQFERALGAAGGIGVSALLFGLYHLRLSQVLPLTLLGLLMAYLAWRTGSLWVPIVVHFAHNAFSVVVSQAVGPEAGGATEELAVAAEAAPVPWYVVVPSVVVSAALVAVLHRRAEALQARRSGAP